MQKQKLLSLSKKKQFRKLVTRLAGAAFMCSTVLGGTNSFAQGSNYQKQNPLWLLSNNQSQLNLKSSQFRFYYNGRSVAEAPVETSTPNLINPFGFQFGSRPYYLYNSMPDKDGNLGFYISNSREFPNTPETLVEIVRADGHEIGKFFHIGGMNPQAFDYPDMIIVPWNTPCMQAAGGTGENEYLLITYNPTSQNSPTGQVLYGTIKPGLSPSSPGDTFGNYGKPLAFNHSDLPALSGGRGTFAVPKPVPSRTQYVYLAVQEGIMKLVVNQRSSTYPGNEPLSTPLNTAGTDHVDKAGAFIYKQSLVGSIFETSELEVSEDGSKLAWANKYSNEVYVLDIDPVTGTPNGNHRTITIFGLTTNRINGLEFIPNSSGTGYSLYVTAGVDGNTIDGLFRSDWTTISGVSSYGSAYRINGTLPSGTMVAQSQIETDYNGNMVMVGTDRLVTVKPSNNGFLPSIGFDHFTPFGDIRRLPRQIDGWHYNVAGLVYGPPTVQVSGSGAAPTQTYSVPFIPGATYSWSYATWSGPVYLPSTTNTQTITFPSTPNTYTVQVEVNYNDACQNQTSGNMIVTTKDGTPPPDGSRMAQVNGNSNNYPTATVYPNPATGRFTLELPELASEATVRIVDVNGKTCKTFTALQQQQTVEVSDLKNGVYLLYVESNGIIATQKLVILN